MAELPETHLEKRNQILKLMYPLTLRMSCAHIQLLIKDPRGRYQIQIANQNASNRGNTLGHG